MSDKYLTILEKELDRLHEILLCADHGSDAEAWAQVQLDRVYGTLCPESNIVESLLEAAPTEGAH